MSRLSSIYRPGTLNTRRQNQIITQDVFPLLDSKEITICLQSCDFMATEELVTKPTVQFIRSLFEQFLDTFMGISRQSIHEIVKKLNKGAFAKTQDEQSLLEKNENAEEDDGDEEDDTTAALDLVVLHRAAFKFFQGCGIHDLTIMDIIRPDPFRTRRLLSAVVNFARFREEHSAECEQLVLESESSLEKIRKVQADNDRIKNQLEDLKAQAETSNGNQKKATLKQVNLYNAKIESELKKLKKAQEILTLEHSQYKEEKSRMIEKLEDQNYLIMESTRELEKLKEYSTTDVSVLNSVIADLKTHLSDYQATCNEIEKRDGNLTVTIESIQLIENELKSLFRILEEISNDIVKEKKSLEKLTANQEYLDQQNLEESDLGRQIQQIERQLANTQEKIDKLKVQSEERITKSQQQLANYRNDYTKLVEERNLREEEYNKKKELIAEIETKMNKKKADFQVEVRNLNLKIARLNVQIKLYLDEVGKKVFNNS